MWTFQTLTTDKLLHKEEKYVPSVHPESNVKQSIPAVTAQKSHVWEAPSNQLITVQPCNDMCETFKYVCL